MLQTMLEKDQIEQRWCYFVWLSLLSVAEFDSWREQGSLKKDCQGKELQVASKTERSDPLEEMAASEVGLCGIPAP